MQIEIRSGQYGDFKNLVSSLRSDFAVFFFDNSQGVGGAFTAYAFPKEEAYCVVLRTIATKPSTFDVDFPHAIELIADITNVT